MSIKLIVGLGNPGKKYESTRHNAGFWLVERLAAQHRLTLRKEPKFNALVARLTTASGQAWLLLPQTWMNESGSAVGALAQFHKIAASEILVAHDELDLPPGGVKIKQGGGHAGHNGLRDIIEKLGSPDFWRLRIGIGQLLGASDVCRFESLQVPLRNHRSDWRILDKHTRTESVFASIVWFAQTVDVP